MNTEILYNNKRFPEYIFNKRDLTCLFFEFDIIFDEEFWIIFKPFLEEIKVDTIVVENIDPVYLFKKEFNVKELAKAVLQAVNTSNLEGFFPDKASLHMITELCLIYPLERKDLFCLFMQRGYDLAILGLPNSKHTEVFNEIIIKDLLDYLTISFHGERVPDHFRDIIYSNWNISGA